MAQDGDKTKSLNLAVWGGALGAVLLVVLLLWLGLAPKSANVRDASKPVLSGPNDGITTQPKSQ
jgi:hypothetical protein